MSGRVSEGEEGGGIGTKDGGRNEEWRVGVRGWSERQRFTCVYDVSCGVCRMDET